MYVLTVFLTKGVNSPVEWLQKQQEDQLRDVKYRTEQCTQVSLILKIKHTFITPKTNNHKLLLLFIELVHDKGRIQLYASE
jgi:hypothetical protein